MRAAFAAAVLAAFLALAPGCGGDKATPGGNAPPPPPAAPQADGPAWLRHVTGNFFAAVVVRPRKLLDAPETKGWPVEARVAEFQRDNRVDPRLLEEVVVLVDSPVPGRKGMPFMGIVVKFAAGADVKAFLDKAIGPVQVEEHRGEKFYSGPGRRLGAMHCDGWYLMGDEESLRLATPIVGDLSPLAKRLRAADPDAALFAVTVPDRARPAIKQSLAAEAATVRPPVISDVSAVDRLSAASVTVKLSGETLVHVVLEGDSDESGARLEELAKGLLTLGKTRFGALRGLAEKDGACATVKPETDLANDLLRDARVARQAARVTVSVARPKDASAAARGLAGAMLAFFRTPPTSSASAPPWLGYVTDDLCAVAIVRPRRLIESPLFKALPAPPDVTGLPFGPRLDPRLLEEVVVLFQAPGHGLDRVNSPATIVKFAAGTDVKAALAKALGSIEEEAFAGKRLFRNTRNRFAALEWDHWCLISSEDNLKRISPSAGYRSPLIGPLQSADPQAGLFAVAVVDPVRGLLKQSLQAGKHDIPAPIFEAATSAADNASLASIAVDLSGPRLLNLVLVGEYEYGRSDPSCHRLEQTAKGLVASATAAADEWRRQAEREGDSALVAPSAELALDLLAGVQVAQMGGSVTISLERPKGAEASPARFVASIQTALRAAELAGRKANLRAIGQALRAYCERHGRFPPAAIRAKDGTPLLSWRVALLPYLEYEPLFDLFHLDEPWDSPHNRKIARDMPPVFATPALTPPGMTSIMVFTGEGTPFGGAQGPAIADIKDGTSTTVFCVEAGPDKAVPWTRPDDLPLDREAPAAALGALADGAFLALFCDGSVRRLDKTIDRETLRRLIEHADGLAVDPEKLK